MVLRGELIAITSAANLDRRRKRDELTQQVQELERIHQCTGAPRIWRQLTTVRSQLPAVDLDRAEYAALRLHQAFYVGGDRCGHLLAQKLRET